MRTVRCALHSSTAAASGSLETVRTSRVRSAGFASAAASNLVPSSRPPRQQERLWVRDRRGGGQPGAGEYEQGAVGGLRLGGGFESRPGFEARAPEGALLGPRPTRPVRQFHARVRAETLRWTVVDEFGETGDHLVPVTGEGA